MKQELSTIGKALDDKTELPWWTVDEYVGILRDCHAKLIRMKPKKSCQSCKFFNLIKCDKANAIPPDNVKAKGCEMFEDNIKDILG